jgi:hypothetical protein
MWRALVAVLLVAGVVCVSVSQTPKAVSSYTLNSWQNQPGKTDQTDHKPVHEGNLMACTNVEPKKDGNECLLRYVTSVVSSLSRDKDDFLFRVFCIPYLFPFPSPLSVMLFSS